MHQTASAASSATPAIGSSRPIVADAPLLLTIPEATRLLSIGRTTLYKLIALQQIKLVKVAGASRIVPSSLDDYLRDRGLSRGGTSEARQW